MSKKGKASKASGKLGILLPGMGAVATTVIAGVYAVNKGLSSPIGSWVESELEKERRITNLL